MGVCFEVRKFYGIVRRGARPHAPRWVAANPLQCILSICGSFRAQPFPVLRCDEPRLLFLGVAGEGICNRFHSHAAGRFEEHQITAANHPDGGAVFTVELPIAPSPGR